jgi:hypothetical protein
VTLAAVGAAGGSKSGPTAQPPHASMAASDRRIAAKPERGLPAQPMGINRRN